jgi:hypothetical protein
VPQDPSPGITIISQVAFLETTTVKSQVICPKKDFIVSLPALETQRAKKLHPIIP